MRLSRALEEKILDVRLRDKLVSEGKINKANVADYLKSLQDDQNNFQCFAVHNDSSARTLICASDPLAKYSTPLYALRS